MFLGCLLALWHVYGLGALDGVVYARVFLGLGNWENIRYVG